MTVQNTKKAVVLLSGGLDSTTCLAIATSQGYRCHALSFAYGQRNRVELMAAQAVANAFNVVEHRIFTLNIGEFGGSAMTDLAIDVPDYIESEDIPVTYVPARNTVFLSIALGLAEVLGAHDIFIGVNAIDYSRYPDCRPDYIAAFTKVANLATKEGVSGEKFQIHTPLIHLTKAEVVKQGLRLGIDYSQTISCYRPDTEGRACGCCDSCTFRKKGFKEAGISDPTRYVDGASHTKRVVAS